MRRLQQTSSGKLQFSGHETFPFRYGWLQKYIESARKKKLEERRDALEPRNAMVQFGVGKNMVMSMRHWALAAGLVEDHRSKGVQASVLGRRLVGSWDPYFEDPGTLWLLHWQIAARPGRSMTWYWLFNHFDTRQFDRHQLLEVMCGLRDELQISRTSDQTLKRDIDCFLRTYTVSRGKNGQLAEDSLECPLAELGLIKRTVGRDGFAFQGGPKMSLPGPILAYALADFWERNAASDTLTLETITYEPGSPGRVFKLDERLVAERLMGIERDSSGAFAWSETAGLRQVHRQVSDADPIDILEHYYNDRPLSDVA